MAERTGWQQMARRVRVPLGFFVAGVFLLVARPSWPALSASLGLVLPGIALRAYASGYVRKNAELTTTGPYAYTRNPLYLGSLLLVWGFAAAAASWSLGVGLTALFALIYLPTIRGEEIFLRKHFAEFDAYAARVPALLPRLQAAASDGEAGSFSKALYLQHREYNCSMGVGAIYAALLVKMSMRHLTL